MTYRQVDLQGWRSLETMAMPNGLVEQTVEQTAVTCVRVTDALQSPNWNKEGEDA